MKIAVNIFRTIASQKSQKKQAMPADSGIMPDLKRSLDKDTFTKTVKENICKF